MNDVTQILQSLDKNDPNAAEEIMPLVYEELRRLAASKMARESPGHTLQATALVHEAWMRISQGQQWESRGHFFAAAAEAMRRILVDNARRKRALKRGGNQERVEFDEIQVNANQNDEELLAVHEALDKLARDEPVVARVVKLRFFAGLTLEETALALDVSRSTAKRHWNYARAWLFRAIQGSEHPPAPRRPGEAP